jgi:hypothetical protein
MGMNQWTQTSEFRLKEVEAKVEKLIPPLTGQARFSTLHWTTRRSEKGIEAATVVKQGGSLLLIRRLRLYFGGRG